MVSIDWVAVTGLATVILVIGTLVAEFRSARREQLISGARAMMDFEKDFESRSMVDGRKELSAALLAQVPPWDLPTRVIDFVENIGFLTRRGVVDLEMVWNRFDAYFLRYYQALFWKHNYMADFLGKDPAIWENATWLYRNLLAMDCVSRRIPFAKYAQLLPSADQIKNFLDKESTMP